MEDRIKISDFAKLTGTTIKTILYYHKIGLLQEPERSSSGYRLYGSAELSRMRSIKNLRSLGLDLKRIKGVLGDTQGQKPLREVLLSLQVELKNEKESIEERIAKIEQLLSEEDEPLDEEILESVSFKISTEILGPERTAKYAQSCPELFDQHRKVFGILDDFEWGGNYQETFRALAEYFKAHPRHYQIALEFGMRLAALTKLAEDDPEVEALARESAEFVKNIPALMEILHRQPEVKTSFSGLYEDMAGKIISPAQVRHGQLLRQYLSLNDPSKQG